MTCMTTALQSTCSTYSGKQICAWLRGLLTLAWADGHYDPEEQEAIASLIQAELLPCGNLNCPERITPQQLAEVLGQDRATAENFLRTAVIVALADGVYSLTEHTLLSEICQALNLDLQVLEGLRHTLYDPKAEEGVSQSVESLQPAAKPSLDVLQPLKTWLDQMDIHDPRLAKFLCQLIPPQCPFERDIVLFGRKIVHIPAMCKLNPLYEQLVGIRFRALSYLADECGEDIQRFC